MIEQLFAILIFCTVGLFVLGTTRLVLNRDAGARRRIASRLANTGQANDAVEGETRLVPLNRGLLEDVFGRSSFFKQLRASLKQATPDVTVEKFLTIVTIVGLGSGLAAFTITSSLIVGAVALLVGGYLPFVILARRKLTRQKRLREQLPDGLDFLGRSLRAGHSLPIGLQMMGSELPSPLANEFQRCYDEISLGTRPEIALKAMVERIDSTDFAFFVTAVLVQRQTGGDLAQVLDNITDMLRQRIRLQQQLKAKTAEGRFTGLILAAFPMVMFLVLVMINEHYMVMVTTSIGKIMLGSALGMSILGLLVIQRIVKVEA